MFDVKSLLKYIFEGFAVGIATFLIPKNSMGYQEIIMISLTAAAVFAVLDQFSPLVAMGARQGTGFGIGYQQIGMGNGVGGGEMETEDVHSGDICQNVNDTCTYSQSASLDDQKKYICKTVDNRCQPEPVGVENFNYNTVEHVKND